MSLLRPRPRTELERDILALQVEHAYGQLRTALVVNLVNGAIVAFIFYGVAEGVRLFAWLSVLILINLVRLRMLRQFEAPGAAAGRDAALSGQRFVLGAFASGLSWGVAGLILFIPGSISHEIFLAFVLGGMAAGAVPVLSPVYPAFALFAVPATLPLILRLVLEGERIPVTMALLVLIFTTAMLVSSRHFHRLLRDAIELRLKLVSSIEQRDREALLARSDSLTGIANRRLFDEALTSEWRRAQRTATALSLVIADIDSFKRYNDSLGHLAGDTCLRRVAQSLATAARRPGDLVARIGGEEFAFILPGTSRADALAIAERVREEILALQIPHPRSSVSRYVTLSLGVAELTPDLGQSPQDLIRAADAALYRAKKQGRNRVVGAAG